MYFTDEKYFQDKAPALNFFSAVPYGLATDEFRAWLLFDGGQALWDEVDAQFGIKPLMLQSTGVQMGGWFNKEVNTPADFKGLRYRMPELGAEVLRRMGATVVLTPAGEIPSALKSGPSIAPSSSDPGPISGSGSIRPPTIITTRAFMSPASTRPSASTRNGGMA